MRGCSRTAGSHPAPATFRASKGPGGEEPPAAALAVNAVSGNPSPKVPRTSASARGRGAGVR
jgi:hypothetical protein